MLPGARACDIGCPNLLGNSCVILGAQEPGAGGGGGGRALGTTQKQVVIQAVLLFGGGAQVCAFLLADFPANVWPG